MSGAKEPTVKLSSPREGILLATLSRPQARNAVNGAMIKEVVACLDSAAQDPKVRCVVFTGDERGKAFCAGADLSPGANNFGAATGGSKPVSVPKEDTFR